MATLTLTIPDTVIPRIRAAFGHADWDAATTRDQVTAFLMESLKLKVKAYEDKKAVEDLKATLTASAW